jgi:cytochrome c biogenesis factor
MNRYWSVMLLVLVLFVAPVPRWLRHRATQEGRSFVAFDLLASFAILLLVILPWWQYGPNWIPLVAIVIYLVCRWIAWHQLYRLYKRRENDQKDE